MLVLICEIWQSNAFIEGVSHKIRRQIEEMERAAGVDGGALTVDGVPVDSYLTRFLQFLLRFFILFDEFYSVFLFLIVCGWACCRFVWDEAKYPTMSPLREIVDGIHVQVAKIEDDMKVN